MLNFRRLFVLLLYPSHVLQGRTRPRCQLGPLFESHCQDQKEPYSKGACRLPQTFYTTRPSGFSSLWILQKKPPLRHAFCFGCQDLVL